MRNYEKNIKKYKKIGKNRKKGGSEENIREEEEGKSHSNIKPL